ncbi:helix-turn-helix transcriptional regulator [Streptomyces sp. SID3343]|uniref:helix-turn-helix domain-containing protein n=1 Tax=Streptomyces sp. SID3343 TaxID=2690260 RepID=UPI00136FCB48|nr:helix-turn-helix transcriptional regulator [Streptomyces sp. SID3343]MYW05009.1 XRE family transcriptional regulator [Streptomyces sp. SID3343]
MRSLRGIEAYPPFDPEAAGRQRRALGLTFARVAAAMVAFRVRVPPTDVAAWEAGTARPGEDELLALAEALWCSPAELMGRPETLREYRLGARLSASELARRLGLPEPNYLRAEAENRWRGDERASALLVYELGLDLRGLTEVAGAAPVLRELLRDAALGRWQARVGKVGALLALRRNRVSSVLEVLNDEFASRATLSLSWVPRSDPPERRGSGVDAQEVFDRFWALLGHPTAHPAAAGVWRT